MYRLTQSLTCGANLSVRDLTIDQISALKIIRVSIKQSKTDPFQRGVDLFLGKSGSDLCPVSCYPELFSGQKSSTRCTEMAGFSMDNDLWLQSGKHFRLQVLIK